MVPKPLKLTTLIFTTALFIAAYAAAGWIQHYLHSWSVLGGALLMLIAAVVTLVHTNENGLAAVGWTPGTWVSGLKKGLLWSLGFALVAALGMIILLGLGHDPVAMMHFALPSTLVERVLFFVVGGMIAPIAEELCFRGVLYTYFRRWGVLLALVASTAIFVALHAVKGIPVTQIVGGIVFAIAYETSGNLTVPITIHTLGNLAIFSLALL